MIQAFEELGPPRASKDRPSETPPPPHLLWARREPPTLSGFCSPELEVEGGHLGLQLLLAPGGLLSFAFKPPVCFLLAIWGPLTVGPRREPRGRSVAFVGSLLEEGAAKQIPPRKSLLQPSDRVPGKEPRRHVAWRQQHPPRPAASLPNQYPPQHGSSQASPFGTWF